MADDVNKAFRRSVDEGVARLERPWPQLAATGMVGGLDVSVGVLAMLVVEHQTGEPLLGALAFGIGFLALTLANSELFTENFLVPVAAVVAKDAPWWSVLRLWFGTLVLNLLGGWVAMAMMVTAAPRLEPLARSIGSDAVGLGIGAAAFASAVIAGAVITLMTWMERSTDSVPAKILAAWAIAFVLSATPLQHTVVISVEAFAALHSGADFGYGQWARAAAWAAAGNIVGGLGLVTTLRLIQVGPREVHREQSRPSPAEDEGDVATEGT